MVLLFGCANSPERLPERAGLKAPEFLTKPLPAPVRAIETNRDLLQLLADYEALRVRFNADRAATALIFRNERAN